MNIIIKELLKINIKDRNELMAIKRKLAKKLNSKIPTNSEILEHFKNNKQIANNRENLEIILRKRSIRTMSGIAPVAILTKPYPCPGQCAYCPTEKNVPKSYLSNEPAVMRAIRCNYNPYVQVQMRLKALEANGHHPEKIEIIVIGGTWSFLPKKYKYWYILNCFKAANDFKSINNYELKIKNLGINKLKNILNKEQKKNENAKYKIIGLTLETRPDYINENELIEMRELGCTRVELGVQAIDDKILKLNKRGSNVEQISRATKMLRDYGFKITYHIMPGLPGSTPKKDLEMFKRIFNDKKFQPDQIKFYPTVVTKGSLLYQWWKQGKYKPYSEKVLKKLIIDCKKVVPKYVRIIRLIRDIPGESIIAGNKITNLRQVLEQEGVKCNCIRCREPKNFKFQIINFKFNIIKYYVSPGEEYFISAESKDGKILYGFCRLYLPEKKQNNIVIPVPNFTGGIQKKNYELKITLGNSALIRELHVYGELVPVGKNKKIQHAGLGKKLMKEAEKISKRNNFNKVAIIAGVGVRNYYIKLGYELDNTYMIKKI